MAWYIPLYCMVTFLEDKGRQYAALEEKWKQMEPDDSQEAVEKAVEMARLEACAVTCDCIARAVARGAVVRVQGNCITEWEEKAELWRNQMGDLTKTGK